MQMKYNQNSFQNHNVTQKLAKKNNKFKIIGLRIFLIILIDK